MSIKPDYTRWAIFIKEYKAIVKRIMERQGFTPEQLLKQIFNGWFVILMREHPKLKDEMRRVMLMPEWPDFNVFAEEITRILTIHESLPGRDMDFAKVEAHVTKKGQENQKKSEILCYSCGKPGHRSTDCKRTAKCDECGGSHMTKFHEKIEANKAQQGCEARMKKLERQRSRPQ